MRQRQAEKDNHGLPLALRDGPAVLGSFLMSSQVSVGFALVLLWFPLWVLRVRVARLSGFDQRAWPKGRHLPLAVLDAIRASFGAWVLLRMLPELPRIEPLGRWQEPALLAAAVAVALAIETLSWRDEDFVFAPVPFLLGLVAAVAHPIVLAIVLPFWIGGSLAVRAWASGFLAAGLGLAAVGLAVSQQDWRLSLLIGLSFCVPVLSSVMAGRHLGWPKK